MSLIIAWSNTLYSMKSLCLNWRIKTMSETRKFKPGDKLVLSLSGKAAALRYPRLKELTGRVVTLMRYDEDGYVQIQEEYDKYRDDGGWDESGFELANVQQWAEPVMPVCCCNTRDLMAYGCPSEKGKQCRSEGVKCA